MVSADFLLGVLQPVVPQQPILNIGNAVKPILKIPIIQLLAIIENVPE